MKKPWDIGSRTLASRFSKFTLNALINYPLRIGIVLLLTEVLHIYYFISYVITLGCVITFSFFFSVYITFQARENKKKTFLKYLAALAAFAGLDALLVKVLTEVFGIYYLISINLVMITLFVLKFFFYQRYVFISKMAE